MLADKVCCRHVSFSEERGALCRRDLGVGSGGIAYGSILRSIGGPQSALQRFDFAEVGGLSRVIAFRLDSMAQPSAGRSLPRAKACSSPLLDAYISQAALRVRFATAVRPRSGRRIVASYRMRFGSMAQPSAGRSLPQRRPANRVRSLRPLATCVPNDDARFSGGLSERFDLAEVVSPQPPPGGGLPLAEGLACRLRSAAGGLRRVSIRGQVPQGSTAPSSSARSFAPRTPESLNSLKIRPLACFFAELCVNLRAYAPIVHGKQLLINLLHLHFNFYSL